MRDQGKTKQQLIEELAELRRSEAKWRSVAANAPLFVAIVDQSGTMQFLNRFRPGFEPATVLGRPIYDFLQPQCHAVARKCLEGVFQFGEATSYESVGAGPDGTLSDYVTDVGPVIVEDEIIAATLISRDVTERRRAEGVLQRQTRELATINRLGQLINTNLSLEQFGEAVVHGITDAINPDVVMLFRRDGLGLPLHSFGPADSVVNRTQLPMHRVGECLCGLAVSERRAIYSPDIGRDSRCTWEECKKAGMRSFAALPLRSGDEIIGVLGLGSATERDFHAESSFLETLANDIALCFHNSLLYEQVRDHAQQLEQKVEERTADLSAANEQLRIFREFAEASGQGFSMADIDGRLLYMNPAFCRMLGIDRPEERLGQHLSLCYPEEANRRGREEIEPFLKKHGRWEGELPLLSRQGKSIPTWHCGFLIRDESGKPFRMAVVITDISQRKQAEEALLKSEKRFRALVTATSDVVYSMSPDWSEMRHLRGREFIPNTEEPSRTWLDKYIDPDDQPHVLAVIHEALRTKGVFELEHRVVRVDGTLGWTFSRAIPLLDDDGEIIEWFGAASDVTARKEAQEALRASEERYALAVRGAGVGLWDWDLRTGKLYFSPRWKTLFGYDESDIGESVEDWARLLHPDEHDGMLKFLEDFLAGASPTVAVEYRLRHKDGSYRWIVAHAVVVRDDQGKAIRLVGSHGDITDRKQAEEALRQSHDELRAIYESLGDGLLVADRETLRLVRANAAICSMLGYSEKELLSMSIPALHPKETLSNIVDPIQTGMVRRLPGKGNVPMLRKDGSVFYADITGDTFTYQGRPYSLGLFRDVTERRQAQAALEREHRTLEHMLKASDHERQLIAYDIHDGLAQYLTGAIMHLQMSEHLREQNTAESAKSFEGGMALLRQGHIEARRLISGVRPPILDESGVMAAISHLIHDPAFDQGPKIEFRSKVTFSRLNPVIENVIYRIVQEGLTNARNHSKSKKIVVSLVQRGERLRIEVRDWGVGFDPTKMPENRFGIDGIRERARLLGGKSSITSKPGEGAAVVVELPAVEERQEE